MSQRYRLIAAVFWKNLKKPFKIKHATRTFAKASVFALASGSMFLFASPQVIHESNSSVVIAHNQSDLSNEVGNILIFIDLARSRSIV